MPAKRIEVRAGDHAQSVAIAEAVDTVKEGKRRARYLASDDFARNAEMAHAFRFVGLYVNNELVFEAT